MMRLAFPLDGPVEHRLAKKIVDHFAVLDVSNPYHFLGVTSANDPRTAFDFLLVDARPEVVDMGLDYLDQIDDGSVPHHRVRDMFTKARAVLSALTDHAAQHPGGALAKALPAVVLKPHMSAGSPKPSRTDWAGAPREMLSKHALMEAVGLKPREIPVENPRQVPTDYGHGHFRPVTGTWGGTVARCGGIYLCETCQEEHLLRPGEQLCMVTIPLPGAGNVERQCARLAGGHSDHVPQCADFAAHGGKRYRCTLPLGHRGTFHIDGEQRARWGLTMVAPPEVIP